MANAELKAKYPAFMQEYIALGHRHAVRDQHGDPSQVYYIPHHAVLDKFRVVFNASAKTSNGVSLNDTQMAGPTIQDLLVNIIWRFRQFAVAMVADVEKMFRQVRVDERHRRWQQILWREEPTQPLQTYQLATVTYGTASGPYLAIRSLQQCGMDNSNLVGDSQRALAARNSILHDFYVDDYLRSAPTVEEAKQLATDVASVLSQGHFHLRKWLANDLRAIPEMAGTDGDDHVDLHCTDTTVLGLQWHPVTDELSYRVRWQSSELVTKRMC